MVWLQLVQTLAETTGAPLWPCDLLKLTWQSAQRGMLMRGALSRDALPRQLISLGQTAECSLL